MKLIQLDQRTPEWHAWRAGVIGGSDAAAVMGVSKWTTIHKLWEQKTGRRGPTPDNPAMARGREMEDEALQAWSYHTGEIASPVCVEHEEISFVGASLDGMTFDGSLIVEIKCPGEKAHQETAETRKVPVYYWPQVQHQLACLPEAEMLHYWSYRPGHREPGILIEVRRDQAYIDMMLEKEAAFWEAVKTDTPPAGDAFLAAEAIYLRFLEEADEIEAHLKEAKEDLIAAVPKGEKKAVGVGLSVSHAEKKGAIDYKTALTRLTEELMSMELPPEAMDLVSKMANDGPMLEAFRKKGSTYWDVRRTSSKGGE